MYLGVLQGGTPMTEEAKETERTRIRIASEISRGDKHGIRTKILQHILGSSKKRSYLSEMVGTLGFTRRTLLLHLAYLVDRGVLSYEYETVPVGEEQRPVVIKWYKVKKEYEFLG